MRRYLTAPLALALAAFFCGFSMHCARGGPLLFSKTVSINRSVNIFDTTQFDLRLAFGNKFFNPTNGVTLFEGLKVSPADVGATFDATLSNDPGFDQAAPRLTDGLNEFVKVTLTEDQPTGMAEQRGWPEKSFFNHLAPQTPPDLFGSTVSLVRLHIDKFFVLTPPAPGGPAALSTGAQFDLVLTLQIYGVPEPTVGCLALAGLMMWGLRPPVRVRG